MPPKIGITVYKLMLKTQQSNAEKEIKVKSWQIRTDKKLKNLVTGIIKDLSNFFFDKKKG